MNTKSSDSPNDCIFQFDPAVSLRNSRLHEAMRDEPDYWTAFLSAFLVACMLAALAICSWQVDGWQSARGFQAQPAVATGSSADSNPHIF